MELVENHASLALNFDSTSVPLLLLYRQLKWMGGVGCSRYNLTVFNLSSDICVVLRLTIKGDKNDEAVLCTSSTTYAIKYVSTSNTVLLIPPVPETTDDGTACIESAGAGVVATASGLIELVETAPRLDKLKTLLNQRPYTEDLDEEQVIQSTLSNDTLL